MRCSVALVLAQVICGALSQHVTIVDTPADIYLGMGGQGLDCWVVGEEASSGAARGALRLELWMAWPDKGIEPYMGGQTEISLPFRRMFSISINSHGALLLRAVLKPADSAEGESLGDDGGLPHAQYVVEVHELQTPLFVRAHVDAEVRLLDGEEAEALAAAAVRLYSQTEAISVQRVVHAFSIITPPASAYTPAVTSCAAHTIWVTIQCARDQTSCAADGFFAFGMDRLAGSSGMENLRLCAARSVPAQVWTPGKPQHLSHLIAKGVCNEEEPLVERSLLPWRRFGARVRERDVNKALVLPDKVCTQRIQVINNSLFVSEPYFDSLPPRALAKGHEKERWYTIALVETLLAVLQQVLLPDIDICLRDELPQIHKGENFPAIASTISDAHMDILAPDLFFRYWSPDIEQDEAPGHVFYKPPRDWSVDAARAAPPWDDGAWARRTPKVWWRGTVQSWHMSARGLLVKMSRQFPDMIDALPLRLVGDALEEEWEGLEEIKLRMSQHGIPDPHGRRPFVEASSVSDGHEYFRFKYLISTHGNFNEWVGHRMRSQLSTGALVFRQDSALREFWEFELEPFQHYIPVAADLSDLVEKIEWALENDSEAQAIAKRGFDFVRESLRPQRIACYWAHLLTGYGELLDYQPQPSSNSTRYINIASRLGT